MPVLMLAFAMMESPDEEDGAEESATSRAEGPVSSKRRARLEVGGKPKTVTASMRGKHRSSA